MLAQYQELRREGRFRELFNVTHAEFLAMPRERVNWLLLAANAIDEGELERAKREAKS